jgi:mannitol/fructose-specific phosphotransferase system IIA component (Ntr-type)
MAIAALPPVSSSTLELVELRHKRRESALAQMVAAAGRLGAVREPMLLLATLVRSERLAPSAIGKGVAVPGARTIGVARPVTLLGRSARGIDWGGSLGPVHLVMLVLSPSGALLEMHASRVLGAAHALRLQRVRQRLMEADPLQAAALLRAELT